MVLSMSMMKEVPVQTVADEQYALNEQAKARSTKKPVSAIANVMNLTISRLAIKPTAKSPTEVIT